ncbi:MAG: response regulator [Magnetococcales bacterium]|nr:response regulator [Magnetococcales bacterium]
MPHQPAILSHKTRLNQSQRIVPWFLMALLTIALLVTNTARATDNTTHHSDARPLIIASANYPLFTFPDQNGEPVGITVDFWKLWSEKKALDAMKADGTFDRLLTEWVPGILKVAGRLDEIPYDLAMAVRSDWPQPVETLNQGIANLSQEGIADLVRKGEVVRHEPTVNPAQLWKPALAILLPILIVLVLFIYWNRHLRREVEERRQAEKALRTAKESANEANRAKTEFLAVMSHEIRTPMNVLLGMVELVLEAEDDPDKRHYLGIAQSSGQALMTLINDMLDLSRIESGKIELESTPFHIGKLIEDVAHIFSISASDKGVELTAHCADDVPEWVTGDTPRIRQLLINLSGNALKFTDSGTILISAENAGTHKIHFSVRDSGIGIPQDKLDMIFKPFSQADAGMSRHFGGVGLGLYICSRIVDKMQGRIWADSTQGEGSTFHLELPLPATEAVIDEQTDSTKNSLLTTQNRVGKKILLVEDSEDNRLLIQAFLRKTPHHLIMAVNGAEAVDLFKQDHFDLVLMDVQMPIKDGYAATREIRQWEKQHCKEPTPIHALSAHAFLDAQRHSLEAGCDGHITKPIAKAKLLKFLETIAISTQN